MTERAHETAEIDESLSGESGKQASARVVRMASEFERGMIDLGPDEQIFFTEEDL